MALPKSHHLPLRFERNRLDEVGKTFYGRFFTVVVAKSSNEDVSTRLAILVSKKTAKKAVDRNKIKRITSSIIESLLPSIPPADYLVIPKHQVLTEDFKVLQLDLQKLLPINQ